MARLAFHTFGLMLDRRGSGTTRGFADRTPAVFEAAEAHPGFIARAIAANPHPDVSRFDWDYGAWGPYALARFYTGGRSPLTDNAATSLSLWQGIEPVGRFAYSGLHKEALDRRQDWFLPAEWPSYVMWWVADDEIPTWGHAAERLEHLHDHGPTPAAFGFRQAFNPDGQPRHAARPA